MSNVRNAIREMNAAKSRLRDAVAKTYPCGSTVSYQKRGHWQIGLVLDHGGVGRTGQLRVENERTGRRYWITMYDILGYIE